MRCSQRLGDVVAHLDPGDEATGRGAARREPVSERTLARLEAIVDASGVAEAIEALLPVGVRPRQLSVRTLLVGILLSSPTDARPICAACTPPCVASVWTNALRLGVVVEWKGGPHALTYRQVERTFSLLVRALARSTGDGTVSARRQGVVDALFEASMPASV